MKYNDNQHSIYVGKKLKIEIFGASHAEQIGVQVTGLKGINVNMDDVVDLCDRRKARRSAYSTKRLEDDNVEILQDFTKDSFVAVIKNTEQRSVDYQNIKKVPRPSHADYVAWTKYGDGFDHRGGGKFSGRLTAPMCIVGGICKELLKNRGIDIHAYISSIGCVDGKGYNDIDVENYDFSTIDRYFPLLSLSYKEEMDNVIESAMKEGDSVGGRIECVVLGVPVGAGEYMFDSIESVLSQLAFAVPAVKGIEFGKGFDITRLKGSQANDSFYYDGDIVKTRTNNNGGINGGIANGMPITFRVAVKPTPSISKEQDSVDLVARKDTKLKIEGRHDACIAPRAVPVIEAIAAIAIYDLLDDAVLS